MRRRDLPIAVVLEAGIGCLVSVAVALMLVAGYGVARKNTSELVREKAELITGLIAAHVRSHLEPAPALLEYLAGLLRDRAVDLSDKRALGELLVASLAAAPQVSAVAYVDPGLRVLRAFRNRPGHPVKLSDWSDDPASRREVEADRRASGAYWSSLFYAEDFGQALITVRMPVRRDYGYAGSLVAAVTIGALSEYLSALGGAYADNAFILYDREFVLAHPALIGGWPGLDDARPLPRLDEFSDPVLRGIWSQERDRAVEASLTGAVAARAVALDGDTYVFLFRDLDGYGERPWLVGTYLRLEDVAGQIGRLEFVPRFGLGILAIALAFAFLLGRALSRPARELAAAATQIRDLDLAAAPELARGWFREMNEAAAAFNAMVAGQRWFMTYVPRSLVAQLMREGGEHALASEDREVTVLFTDIVGFTAFAEDLPAAQVAEFLNAHFTVVGACVEAEGGTIDKYIGDAMMAFWGAPERQGDHAARACRAAQAMARRIRLGNERRRKSNLPPVRLRIGVHTGRALVGNIGAPGRINYTVIGDTVNIAERLEGLARQLVAEDEEVATLVTATTAAHLADRSGLVPAGRHRLRGRHEEIAVYRLAEATEAA